MLFVVVAIFSLSSYGQQKKPTISFDKDVFQFGKVKEEAGNVKFEYIFTNIGAEPLTINSVNGEYGIKLTSWTKVPVKAGGKGYIKGFFNPNRNTGKINKKITVKTNATNPVNMLKVMGTVIPKPKTIADEYRRTFGSTGLRLNKTYLSLGNITNKQIKTQTIDIVNTSISKMKITFRGVPKYATVTVEPQELKPEQKGVITIIYNAEKNIKADGKQNWGAQNARFYTVINDDVKSSSKNTITVRSTIKEDFSNLSEKELAQAPKIKFEMPTYNFGEVKQGEVVKYEYKFTNLGENDLEIRRVKGS